MASITTSDSTFQWMRLDHETTSRLFPFFVLFDQNLRIMDMGPSFRKMVQSSGAVYITDILRITRPSISPAELLQQVEQGPRSMVFTFKSHPLTKLKGELQKSGENTYMFFGSVWVGRIDALGDLGLSFSDFSSNDPTVDYLHLMKSHEIVANELRDTLTQLHQQREELILHSLLAEETENYVLILDQSGEIEWANRSFEEGTGFRLEEIKKRTLEELFSEDHADGEGLNEALNCAKQGKAFTSEVVLPIHNGIPIWVKWQGQPVTDSEGRLWKYFALIEDITEKRRSADENKLLSERLKLALDASGAAIFEYGFDQDDFICDDQFHKLFRIQSGTKVTMRHFRNWVHRDDLSTFRKMAEETSKGLLDSYSHPLTFLCGDKTYRRFLVRYHVFKDEELRPVKMVGVLMDIDSVAQLEQALKIQTKRYAQLIANMHTGVLVEDENRRIVLTNQLFLDFFNISAQPEDMIGMDCSLSAEYSKHLFADQELFVSRINEILFKQEAVLQEELEMADGRILERNYFPLIIDSKYHGHLWQYRDITSRKFSELELKRNEEKYRKIIENMNLGLIEVDNDERVRFANQSFCRMSGYTQEELQGRRPSELFLNVRSSDFINSRVSERKKGRSGSYELEILDKNGHRRWWMISGAPLYDLKGTVEGSIGIHLDVTGQKLLENGLRNAKQLAEDNARAKEIFLANMSHELRTPVNGIIGVCRLLKNMGMNEQQENYVNLLENTTVHLSKVLGDVLDLSRISANEVTIETSRFNLNDVIEDVVKMLVLGIQKSNIEVVTFTDKLWKGEYIGDVVKIKQILFNLVGNAVKFTSNGKVVINASSLEGENDHLDVYFEIIDSGVGMSEEFLKVAFTKFSQEDSGLSRKYGGAGLGLSITRNLVEMMNGTIAIESRKNEGTKVMVHLPLKGSVQEEPQLDSTALAEGLRGMRVLIAEDNELNAMVLRLLLEAKECHVDVCASGFEVIDKVSKEDFDIILMDLHMPGMDGYQTTLTIRNDLHLKTPIIALTADMRKGESVRCFAVGMNEFLLKPYEESVLYQKMARLVNKRLNTSSMHFQSVNLSMLERAAQGNPEFIRRMLNIFMKETDHALGKFEAPYHASEAPSMRETAHRLRTSLNNLGLSSAASTALKVEELIDTQSRPESVQLEVANMVDHLQRARLDVQRELERLEGNNKEQV